MVSDIEPGRTIRSGRPGSRRQDAIRPAALPVLLGAALAATAAFGGTGGLDPTFGDAGRVLADVGPGLDQDDWPNGAILQSNGKLLVVGSTDVGEGAMLLARFNADGAPDTSFGNGGHVIGTDPDEGGAAVIEQGDGKLLVVGRSGGAVGVWRFTADGAADPAFGAGGLVRLTLDGPSRGRSIAEQADSRIVVAATVTDGNGAYRAELVRLRPDGDRDATFGNDGRLRLDVFGPILLQQSDGKLIVVGMTDFGVVVIRASDDGVLDEAFGDGGRAQVLIAGAGQFVGFASGTLQDDGKVLVSGWVGKDAWFLSDGNGFIVRLDATGALDPEFGDGGMVIGVPAIRDDALRANAFKAIETLPDGRIAVAQTITRIVAPGYWPSDLGLAVFNPDGTIDTTFGVDGSLIADFGRLDRSPSSNASGMVQQADGNLVIVGFSYREAGAIALARFGLQPGIHPGFVGLATDTQAGAEEDGIVEVTVRRTGGSFGAVAISYATADGSALAASDYEPQSGVLEWADGDASDRIIEVALVADDSEEGEEQFALALGAPEGGALLATSMARITVTDRRPEPDSGSDTSPPLPTPPSPAASNGAGSAGWLGVLLLSLAACRRARRQSARSGWIQ